MKPVIIGQAPAQGNDDLPPFAGRSGARLAKLGNLGDDGSVLPEYFDLYNVLNFWPGKATNKGDQFWEHGDAVDEGVAFIRLELAKRPSGCYVLLMGRQVQKAFLGQNYGHTFLVPYSCRFSAPDKSYSAVHECMTFPHPSGVSTWWNDPHRTQQASESLKRVLRDSKR